ncbi:hypothetical protein PGT21_027274 [Puccinia graminis f. sp. tritici]|uniref:Uncharacterized protein n=1 Tax=Puccinia graminis f. sp. tritici TaxID=56615 RepID=A0A5B0NVH1_PUCGR|nr:hypothetical protein PGT21_016134 [Puccinia graminis f. sp. tritici]KAA1093297.1 hypothetical protein PGTUg99_015403 [Puccinia graminis f. sp. tritici]KAA1119492.1 hypothetical protein PGT21_027274 [Puccinia graminis f. sp. tritici]
MTTDRLLRTVSQSHPGQDRDGIFSYPDIVKKPPDQSIKRSRSSSHHSRHSEPFRS